ncbi:MAG: heavy-metal-associated domain-containing protein [Thiohalophilus sp.]|uniref:heavy-metal-associated domain-containing protein n=1 Tax=Thiohalophilus sp. TaxID=3028392 RepID=UPI00287052D8|nr:heavy-metal-associated domain-containing protein [Thiohalophilus sp.]MDR9436572.1 heavy-metal-associated domain-containing protein [Thiohalophilus sp.]
MSDTLQITAQNIKCGGCVAAIENGLKALPGIDQVEVTIDNGLVRIEGENLSEQAIRDKLAELGYPAADPS